MDQELEFKFAVQGEADFKRLADFLGRTELLTQRGVQQVNHFFDTASHQLHAQRMVLRLREEAGIQRLTFKCDQEDLNAAGSATRRTEIEVSLTPAEALKVLQGELPVLQALEERVTPENAAALTPLRELAEAAPLRYIGYFKNLRRRLERVPVQVDGDKVLLCFELDRCSFGPGDEEFEIEVEWTGELGTSAIEQALSALLQAAGVEWQTAPSKSQRFYAMKQASA